MIFLEVNGRGIEVGDLILTSMPDYPIIEWFCKKFDVLLPHSAIYIGQGLVLNIDYFGVKKIKFDRFILNDRLKICGPYGGLTDDQKVRIFLEIKKCLNDNYSVLKLFLTAFDMMFDVETAKWLKSDHCTSFCQKIYRNAGFFVGNKEWNPKLLERLIK